MIPDQARTLGGGALAIVMIDTASKVPESNDARGKPTQWTYTGKPVAKILAGYGTPTKEPSDTDAWPPSDEWTTGLNNAWYALAPRAAVYNMREANNTFVQAVASSRLGNGVSHSGGYPAGFEMQPLEIGGIYPAIALTIDGALEFWTWQPNGEDGTCT